MKDLYPAGIIGLIGSSLLIYGFFELLNYIYEYSLILSGFGLTYQIVGSDLLNLFILNAILQLIFGIITLISSIIVLKQNKFGIYILLCVGIITIILMFIIIRPRQEFLVSPTTTLIINPIRLLSNHTIDISPFIILIAGLLPYILKFNDWIEREEKH
jgi:hypothetical protein